jgi:hypothetical protein
MILKTREENCNTKQINKWNWLLKFWNFLSLIFLFQFIKYKNKLDQFKMLINSLLN